MKARIEYKPADQRVSIWCSDPDLHDSRELDGREQERFSQWITGYRQALRQPDHSRAASLLAIGQDIWHWLDGDESWLERLTHACSSPPLVIEFMVSSGPSQPELSFLEVPWELLASQSRHLAADPCLIYGPVRRIGKESRAGAPSGYRLSLVFMAAAPRGEGVPLQYEAEETAILDATGSIGLDLTVEESGTLPLLAECMARDAQQGASREPQQGASVDVLHISCHGIMNPEPSLMLETDEGDPCPTTAMQLGQKLGGNRPRLLFLSACLTSGPDALFTSLSSSMIRLGVPAVLGWGGSVGDRQATRFAARLYDYLSLSNGLEEALARGRFELFQADTGEAAPSMPGDWHLARLYLGPHGGGVLARGERSRHIRDAESGYKEFLNTKDKTIPVAGRREFVGRRRQIQQILREFRQHSRAGVLIHGLGRQGKSSLAARIANRMSHLQPVIVNQHYGAKDILEAFAYFAGTEEVTAIVNRHREQAAKDPAYLAVALRELLEGPCRDVGQRPVLLIIDDFEQALTDPHPGGLHRVKADLVDSIRALIEAFNAGGTRSRLLITSRYAFTLPHRGRDLAQDFLFSLHLPAMEEYESRKQVAAREMLAGASAHAAGAGLERTARCIKTARGNPGLLTLLFALCLESPDAGDRALQAMETYITSGREPDEEKLHDFIKNLAIDSLIGLLSRSEKELLRASTLFDLPVPVDTLSLMARQAVLSADDQPIRRLQGLGLWEVYEDLVNPAVTAGAVNELVRPRAGALSQEEESGLAKAVIHDLFNRWGGSDGGRRPYPADHELARLALLAEEMPVLAATAEDAVRWLEKRFLYREAASLANESIAALQKAKVTVSPNLLRLASERCQQIGDMAHARTYIGGAIDAFTAARDRGEAVKADDFALALVAQARLLVQAGYPGQAVDVFKEAEGLLKSDPFLRERSIVLGELARIKVDRGEVDEALKLHQEELNVYDALGDKRSRAVTLGDIAHIKVSRGEVDEALKLQSERLQVNKELGDVDGKASALWGIAQIELQLESYQEAFEHLQESYNLFINLGRLDGISMVGLYLGNFLCQAGHKKEGLDILTRSRDGFKKLGQQDRVQQIEEMIRTYS